MNTERKSMHVLIAGGGVAALEAMMALRALAGDRVRITLLAPEREFHYRPMAVAEPFSIAAAKRLDLASLVAESAGELVAGTLAAVDPDEHRVLTAAGASITYDALVIACGTRTRPAFAGALTVDDRDLGATLRGLVQDIEEGYTRKVAFVAPAQAFWPLPLYELALLTAHQAFGMNVAVEISIVTPESEPLGMFGAVVSAELTRLLRDAGIVFRGSSFAVLDPSGELTLAPSADRLRPELVVALPLLEGPGTPGIVTDVHGFIPVTEFGQVRGQADVFAAGDATAYPIKHGGIAAQQADVVAAAIAARAGAAIDPQPLRPVIRAMLLTGAKPRFFEAELLDAGGFAATVSDVCQWDPPTKIAADHLGRYLADHDRDVVRV
jgi:sulfide:quinone oxidoreductase